jgi:rhodanese-related sulfurtransferase
MSLLKYYAIFGKKILMRNVLLFLLLLTVISCSSQTANETRVGADAFEKLIARKDVQVLDVRTANEFKGGHIKNALQADWTDRQEFAERLKYIDKDKPVYVYCLVGSRSTSAADWMRQTGFKNVIELTGGINAWKRAGKPVDGSGPERQMTMTEYLAAIPADKTMLVDFGAAWCPPCVKMEPVLNAIKADKSLHFSFLKIDAGVHIELMKLMNIEPIPVFIIYKNGKEVWRKQGIVSKEELAAHLK